MVSLSTLTQLPFNTSCNTRGTLLYNTCVLLVETEGLTYNIYFSILLDITSNVFYSFN